MNNDDIITDPAPIEQEDAVVNIDRVAEMRARMASIEGGKKDTKEASQAQPQANDFEVVVEMGTDNYEAIIFKQCFLIATTVFIGFTNAEGLVLGCIPMGKVAYVRPLED